MRLLRRALVIVLAAGFGCAAYLYFTIPDVRVLRTANPETTAFIELRADEARQHGRKPRRVQRWVRYERISPHLIKAVIVTEDAAFWLHDGVDYEQIKESMEVNLERREFARGASTITQQLAKNLYLSPSKTPLRKLRELLIARRLEGTLSKRRILELYLNVIEWGDGIYGAEAAARIYFGKTAAQLNQAEAASMAAAIMNPRTLNPGSPTARLQRRQRMILRRMGAVIPPAASKDASPDVPAPPDLAPVPQLPAEGVPEGLPGGVHPKKPDSPQPAPPCERPPCS
jgi:monofunctional biosynthetic peptidoglycan transglycosylase